MKMFMLIVALFALPITSYAEWGRYGQARSNHNHHYNYNYWDNIDQRLERQIHRIERGVQNGELTRREAKRLHRQHYKLDKRIDRIRNKHWVDHYDRKKVRAYLDRASDKIYHLKHNDRYVHRNQYRHHVHHNSGYRNDRRVIRANNDYSAGFYFRF